jgi:hypothetical protein
MTQRKVAVPDRALVSTVSITTPAGTAKASYQRLVFRNWPDAKLANALSPNGSRQQHWATRKQNVDRVHARTALTARVQELSPMHGLVVLHAVYTFDVARHRDPDNLSGGGVLKHVIDALVRGKWLDGDDTTLLRIEPVEVRVERGVRQLELTFKEMSAVEVTATTARPATNPTRRKARWRRSKAGLSSPAHRP